VKKQKKDDPFDKLMHLTKLIKTEKISVAKRGFVRSANKWRSQEPKFAEKTQKPEDVVEAGGMQVDPALREQYDNWRKDKEEEQKYRRTLAERRRKAEEEARKARPTEDY
jgi:hypothetical protein